MGQDVQKIEKLYDTVAVEYSEKFHGEHETKPEDQEIFRRFAMAIGDHRPVWDFGCGSGETTAYLTKLGIEISGMDLSENILEQARCNNPGIHFRKGNMLELSFGNDSIAGIVAFYAIVHFSEEQVDVAFREVFRVLHPGGIFLFTYHIGEENIHVQEFLGKKVDIDLMLFKTDFIVSCLKRNGFTILDVITREPYPEVEYETQRAYVLATKLV